MMPSLGPTISINYLVSFGSPALCIVTSKHNLSALIYDHAQNKS